ncbi:uncharacterized protein LOC143151638 [Ptiloglossa arizonensis]|uniref:uncharacterized protein LOC143151638 n=1 Tax=Ptiloglossa arizonensis TaxID=3350558 RepID=UPI003FA106CC
MVHYLRIEMPSFICKTVIHKSLRTYSRLNHGIVSLTRKTQSIIDENSTSYSCGTDTCHGRLVASCKVFTSNLILLHIAVARVSLNYFIRGITIGKVNVATSQKSKASHNFIESKRIIYNLTTENLNADLELNKYKL